MINIAKIHYEIARQLNRIDSEWKANISVVDKDGYINQAKDILLENYNAIAEKNRTLSDRLKSIEISNYKLAKIKSNSIYDTYQLPPDHYSTLKRYAIASGLNCSITDRVTVHDTQKHKVDSSLIDPNWDPNFNWRETFSNEDKLGLNVYHDSKMIIKDVYIDYIRFIPDVAYVSGVKSAYILPDGSTVQNDIHLDIDDSIVWRKIADLALVLIKRDFDDNYTVNVDTILFSDRYLINQN